MKSEICSSVLPSGAARTFSFSVDPEFVATLCPNIKKMLPTNQEGKKQCCPQQTRGETRCPVRTHFPLLHHWCCQFWQYFPLICFHVTSFQLMLHNGECKVSNGKTGEKLTLIVVLLMIISLVVDKDKQMLAALCFQHNLIKPIYNCNCLIF